MLSGTTCFEDAGYETKHRVIAWLVDRIEAKKDYEITIHWRVTSEQLSGRKNEESA